MNGGTFDNKSKFFLVGHDAYFVASIEHNLNIDFKKIRRQKSRLAQAFWVIARKFKHIFIVWHDDCCTRLMPKNPETKAKLPEVLAAEKNLDVEELISQTLKKTELIK